MRIAVVTCKVKPPSADMDFEEVTMQPKGNSPVPSTSNGFSPFNNPIAFFGNASNSHRLPSANSANDDFVREIIQLCNFWGKSKQVRMGNVKSELPLFYRTKWNLILLLIGID
jgi:hypothetical protein